MVAAQVALLIVLLTSAGLFMRSLQKLRSIDAGFQQDQVLVVNVSTGSAFSRERLRVFHEELYARLNALPGVRSISMAMDTPPAGELSMCAGIELPGRAVAPEDAPCHNFVGPRFFETLGIPVLSGRDFEVDDDERAQQRVVISGVSRDAISAMTIRSAVRSSSGGQCHGRACRRRSSAW